MAISKRDARQPVGRLTAVDRTLLDRLYVRQTSRCGQVAARVDGLDYRNCHVFDHSTRPESIEKRVKPTLGLTRFLVVAFIECD